MRAPDLRRTATCTCLIDLPAELLTAICGFVECRTVVQCRSVCKRIRDIIDTSLELQYRIELVQDGMIDERSPTLVRVRSPGPRNGTTSPSPSKSKQQLRQLATGDRLARLRQLRHAWQTLTWARCVTVPMPGPCCAYELVGGIFCKTQPGVGRGRVGGGEGTGFDLAAALTGWNGNGIGNEEGNGNGNLDGDGDEVHHVFGSRALYATWLPARGDADDDADRGRTVMRDDLGIPTRDFAMDPSQDLMVLLKGGEDLGIPMVAVFPGMVELHVRTLSTNEVHPEAREPVLCMQVLHPITSVFFQIVDDVVGMMYCIDPSRPRITIWNWRTGDLVVGDGHLPPGTWDFSFINSRALFVTTGNSSGALELFTFTCGRTSAGTSPPSYDTPISTLTHVATLYLPAVQPSVRLLSVGTHTGPFLATCPPDKLFVASNEARIHVVTIQYVHAHVPTLDGPRTRQKVCIFVHNRVLDEHVQKGLVHGAAEGAGAIAVPWSDWGQTRARMLPYVGTFQWLRYVHGQRVVLLLPTPEAGRSTLQVLDFNVCGAFAASVDAGDDDDSPHRDANADASPVAAWSESGCKTARSNIVDYPTQIFTPNIFVDVVESGLPYREVLRDVRGDYSGMMIDDERLIGLKYPAFLTGDMKEIDVFTM